MTKDKQIKILEDICTPEEIAELSTEELEEMRAALDPSKHTLDKEDK